MAWNESIAKAWLERPRARPSMAPLFHAAWLYALGIATAHWWWFRPGWLLLGLLALGAISALAARRAPRIQWLALAALWLALGALSGELQPPPAPAPQLAPLTDGLLRTIEGVVVDAGAVREHREQSLDESAAQSSSQSIDVETETVEVPTDDRDDQHPAVGLLRLNVHGPRDGSPAPALECGDRIRAVTRPLPAEQYRDPGVWDRQEFLLEQGITASSAVRMERLERIGRGRGLYLPCRIHQLQHAASARLLSLPGRMRRFPAWLHLSEDDAVMLAAMATGDRTMLSQSLRVGFERTGSFHMLVVSGLHLAIVAGCIFWVARKLHLRRAWATLLTLGFTTAYALFAGFATSVQRSLWMIALYLLGRMIFRQRSRLNVIGFAALSLLAVSPRSLFDSSFQMTLLAVISIAGIGAPLLACTLQPYSRAANHLDRIGEDLWLLPHLAQFRVMLRLFAGHGVTGPLAASAGLWPGKSIVLLVRGTLRLLELIFICLVVEAAMTLPMALYFHRITLYALPVNLLILPILALIMPMALVLLALAVLWPAAAAWMASVVALVLHFALAMVNWFGARLGGDWRIPAPTLGQSLAFCALLAASALLAHSASRLRTQWLTAASALLLAAAALVPLWPRPIQHPGDALFVEAIDVGQGDSILLITPEGRTLLVDGGGFGGGPRMATQDFDIGEEVVSQALWARGIRHLDSVALTHAHSDHMGGLPAVLRNFHPSELWIGNNPHSAEYDALLEEARGLGVEVRPLRSGDEFPLGSAVVRVLAPPAGYQPEREAKNNDSLVLRVAYRESSVLLMGDAEAPVEDSLLNTPDLQSTLLKVGHHGSRTSSRSEFLARVAPQWAVISAGRRNRYGHPNMEVLEELESAHILTFSTDLNGATCFRLDGHSAQPLLGCGRAGGP